MSKRGVRSEDRSGARRLHRVPFGPFLCPRLRLLARLANEQDGVQGFAFARSGDPRYPVWPVRLAQDLQRSGSLA